MKYWLSLNLIAILIALLLTCAFSLLSINADSTLSNDDVNSVDYYNDAADYAFFGEDDAPINSIDSTEDETDIAAADSVEPDFDSLNGDLNEADIDSVVEVNSASQDNFGATEATGAGFAEKKPGFFKRWLARFKALFDRTRKSKKAQRQQQKQQQQQQQPQSAATQQTTSSSTGSVDPSSSDASADEQEQLDPDYIGAVYSHSIKDMETLQQDSTNGSSVDPAQPITSERRVYYPTRSRRGQRAHKIVNIYNNHNHMRLHPQSPQYYTPQHYYGHHYTYPNYHLPHTSQYGFSDLSGNWHWNAAVYQRYMTYPFLNAAGKEKRVSHYIRKYLRGTRADFIKHGLLNTDDTVVGQQELGEQHKVITPRDDDLVEIPVMIPIYDAANKPTQQSQQQPQPSEQVDASESTGVAQQAVDPKQQQASGSPAAAQQEADEPVDDQPDEIAPQQATGAYEQQTVTGAASVPAVQSQPQHPSADSGASGVAASSPAAVPTVSILEQSASASNAMDSGDEQNSPAGDAPAPAAPATSSTLAAAAGSAQNKAAAAVSTPTAVAQNDQAFDEPPDQAKSAQQKK